MYVCIWQKTISFNQRAGLKTKRVLVKKHSNTSAWSVMEQVARQRVSLSPLLKHLTSTKTMQLCVISSLHLLLLPLFYLTTHTLKWNAEMKEPCCCASNSYNELLYACNKKYLCIKIHTQLRIIPETYKF